MRRPRRRFAAFAVALASLAAAADDGGATRSLASGDGAWRIVVSERRGTLALLDRDGRVVRTHPLSDLARRATSRVAALHDAPRRRSFVVALRDLPEVWEISYDPDAAPIYDGLVHDHRLGEAIATPGHLGVRRTRVPAPLADLQPTGDPARWIGVGCGDAASPRWLVHLDVRQAIGALPPLELQAACSR